LDIRTLAIDLGFDNGEFTNKLVKTKKTIFIDDKKRHKSSKRSGSCKRATITRLSTLQQLWVEGFRFIPIDIDMKTVVCLFLVVASTAAFRGLTFAQRNKHAAATGATTGLNMFNQLFGEPPLISPEKVQR